MAGTLTLNEINVGSNPTSTAISMSKSQCKSCDSTSSRLKLNLCSSCYAKHWRKFNSSKVTEYSKTIKDRFGRAKRQAKLRLLDWDISLEEFAALCGLPCYYCSNLIGEIVLQGSGLDRLDSNIGYNISNVVSCCTKCNIMKSDILTSEEMKKVAELIISIRDHK